MEKEIKCHLCGGKALLKMEELSLNDGKIILKDSPYYQCQKCKEEFATSEQMRALSDQLHQKFQFQRPIINAGRSLAITLPSDLVHFYKLKKGEKITIIPESSKEWRIRLAG